MDRSFLSDEAVVSASRNFVCMRLATYEDAAEAKFLKSIYLGRSGDLENTTFVVLAPDGKTKLTAAGRGPFHAFRGSAHMAAQMNRISQRYPATERARFTDQQLPKLKDLELALNVASADNLPLIVTVAGDSDQTSHIKERLLGIAWSEQFAGQFAYGEARSQEDLKPITGVKNSSRVLVVQPGQFGLSGKVLAQFDDLSDEELVQRTLRQIVADFPRNEKSHGSHVQLGIQLGIDWQSEIPETDPQSVRARQRARGDR